MNLQKNLKAIRFEGELLPNWAQLLDLAAMSCPVSEEVRHWFSRLTMASGVDDSRTVIAHCGLLRANIEQHGAMMAAELMRTHYDFQPPTILKAWTYALDTMIQVAQSRKTCAWMVEGAEEENTGDSDGGDITLRRV